MGRQAGRQAGKPTKGTHRKDLNNLLKGVKKLKHLNCFPLTLKEAVHALLLEQS
jgi:hypothetical protein